MMCNLTPTHKTRFQVILPVHSHNVTKNLTGQRMHVEGPQIYQMNMINSSQNMCDVLKAKIDNSARKIDYLQKKHLKIHTRSTSGLPLKTWGYDDSN